MSVQVGTSLETGMHEEGGYGCHLPCLLYDFPCNSLGLNCMGLQDHQFPAPLPCPWLATFFAYLL